MARGWATGRGQAGAAGGQAGAAGGGPLEGKHGVHPLWTAGAEAGGGGRHSQWRRVMVDRARGGHATMTGQGAEKRRGNFFGGTTMAPDP